VPEWFERFEPFSLVHGLTVVVASFVWLLLIRTGLGKRGTPAEPRWRLLLSGLLLSGWLLANGVQLLPAYYVAADNLPLHPCDLVGLLVPYAIWSRRRLAQAVLYFWGIGLSLQAVITPDLRDGPAHVWFWTFWIPHASIIGAAVYVLVVERFVPDWTDCLRAYALALLYVAVILPFDLLSGFNYGFLGPGSPKRASLLDLLGPWPWRVGVIIALAAAGFVFLQLPWALRGRRDRGRA
jgi:hypothetical integral membrane protein (TIGR02206 family)